MIPGTDGGIGPFFSPDGGWIGFFANGALRKVALSGGSPQTIVAVQTPLGASWSADDTIVWGEWGQPLFKVSAKGGQRQPLTTLDPGRGEVRHSSPRFSADGRLVIFSVWYADTSPDIGVVEITTGRRALLGAGSGAYLVNQQLVIARGSALFSAPFDRERLSLAGDAVRVLDGVAANQQPQFAVAADGTLVYLPAPTNQRRLVWVDRTGKMSPVLEEEQPFVHPRVSPAGDRVLVQIARSVGVNEFWILDTSRRTRVRLGTDGSRPVWEPDGTRITFQRGGNLHSMRADDSGAPELLLAREPPATQLFPLAWSAAAGVLVFSRPAPETNRDVFTMRRGEQPRPFLVTPRDERAAMLSPDARWMVYAVREVGREEEVFVEAFPSGGSRTVVSSGGGIEPVWSPTGTEIFYRSTDGRGLFAVDVATQPQLRVGTPRLLFQGSFLLGYSLWADYDVARDGSRFVMIEGTGASTSQLHVALNWMQTARR
jgi:serine/threonine-protein kinase